MGVGVGVSVGVSVGVGVGSVRNEGGGSGGVKPPHNCTGPWHLCFSR